MQHSYQDVHPEHMSGASHRPSSGDRRYSYQQPPQLLNSQQPAPTYSQYPYGGYAPNGMAPQLPATSGMMPHSVHLPAMTGAPTGPIPGTQNQQADMNFDHTGQVAPPGMKPRVTATLWEDEGTLCFQVEAKSVCVARREDNHFINGTKLLNVAGMTRGRRDGILKSEKTRHVVKIGPMHLKGVWIPFERALEFANKEKITELLYPLFVHDIGSLLYHPSNQPGRPSVGNATMTAIDRSRRPDPMQNQRYIAPPTSQPPGLHHHHSMSNPMAGPMSQPPLAITQGGPLSMPQPSLAISQAPHMQPHGGRPSLDRAHTFPTPPTSATVAGLNGQGPSQDWSQTAYPSAGASQPLAVDTGISNPHTVPGTPATTPPGNVQQSMSYPTAPGYDNSRNMYSAPPPQHAQYNTHSQMGLDYQRGVYPQTDMAQPPRPVDHADSKPQESMLQQGSDPNAQPVEQGEGEHEQGNEYTHTSSSYNNPNRNYTYTTNGAPAPLHSENIAPDMTSSPHQTASGRQTPRTTATGAQGQWNTGYANPQRSTGSSYSMSNILGPQPGNPANGNTPAGAYQPSPAVNHYSNQGYSTPNGVNSAKRSRDGDEQDTFNRPDSVQGDDMDRLKRRKTMEGGAVGAPTFANPGPGLQRARTTISGQGM